MPVSRGEGSMTRMGIIFAAILALVTVSLVHLSASLPAKAVGSPMTVGLETTAKPLSKGEAQKIEAYMRQVFGNPSIRLVSSPPDAEVYLGEHFLGVVFPTDDKEGRTFYFEMSIFDSEIEEARPVKRNR